jgi:hypothetical protein
MLETWFGASLVVIAGVVIAGLVFVVLNCRQKIRLLGNQVKLLSLEHYRKDQYIAELQRRCERLKRNEQGSRINEQGSMNNE